MPPYKQKFSTDDFKVARVTPIFKNGETDDLGYYRPISILGSLARGFEELLYKQLHEFLVENKILNPIQAGVFWNHIGWGGTLCPPPLFLLYL